MSLYASSLLSLLSLCLFFFLLDFSSLLLSFSPSTLTSAVDGAEREVENEVEKEAESEVVAEEPKKYFAAILKDRIEEF
jgi:hypothetical protein